MTLAELLAAPDRTAIIDKIFAVLQGNGFPATDWTVGGVERTRMLAWVTALADFAQNYVPQVAAGGFTDYAQGPWLQLLAQQRYDVPFNKASQTVGNLLLTNARAASYTINPGQFIVQFNVSGNRYISSNTSPATLAGSSTLLLPVTSEFPNNSTAGYNYNDGNNSSIRIVTSLPGVTATNPGKTYSNVIHNGTSLGTITLAGTPTTPPNFVTIKITDSGQAATMVWQYSKDGAAYVTGSDTYPASLGDGIVLTFTNAAGASASFVAGDTYQFSTPGSWITTQGADVEKDPALSSRCHNRWPSLSSVPTLGFYDAIARKASNQVTLTYVKQDPSVNNKVDIWIAGQYGQLPIATVEAVKAFVQAFAPETDYPVILSPTAVPLTIFGTLYYSSKYVAQNNLTLSDYEIRTVAPGTTYIQQTGINGFIDLSEVITILRSQPGVNYIDLGAPFTIGKTGGPYLEQNLTISDSAGLPAIAGAVTWSIAFNAS